MHKVEGSQNTWSMTRAELIQLQQKIANGVQVYLGGVRMTDLNYVAVEYQIGLYRVWFKLT